MARNGRSELTTTILTAKQVPELVERVNLDYPVVPFASAAEFKAMPAMVRTH